MNRDISTLILRLVFGGFMLWNHGLNKFLEVWSKIDPFIVDVPLQKRNLFGLGTIISIILFIFGELIAPLFVIIGYKTRVFAVFSAITMFFAFILVHLKDPASGESAILFLTGFIIISSRGPGKYSIDRKSL